MSRTDLQPNGLHPLQFGRSTREQRHPTCGGCTPLLGSAGEVSARAALVAEGLGQFQQVAITEITEMSDRERISAAGPSRAPAVRQPPHRPSKAAKEAQTCGREQPGASPAGRPASTSSAAPLFIDVKTGRQRSLSRCRPIPLRLLCYPKLIHLTYSFHAHISN